MTKSSEQLTFTEQDVSFDNLLNHLFKFKNEEDLVEAYSKALLNKIIAQSVLSEKYNVVFLYDERGSITSNTADSIYRSVSKVKDEKDILLIIHSPGGQVEPAYLISKCCKELSKKNFIVVVPRRAKSAATLLSLGADQVHMGIMSELGPIDPQLRGLPVLGIQQTIETLAKLASDQPGSSKMLADYLSATLRPQDIGYFSRIAESAKQYAERLLTSKEKILPAGKTPTSIALDLVYEYKDHGFAIDKDEATKLLGNKIVVVNSEEYLLADELHKSMSMIRTFCDLFMNREFKIVGDINDGMTIFTKDDD